MSLLDHQSSRMTSTDESIEINERKLIEFMAHFSLLIVTDIYCVQAKAYNLSIFDQ